MKIRVKRGTFYWRVEVKKPGWWFYRTCSDLLNFDEAVALARYIRNNPHYVDFV